MSESCEQIADCIPLHVAAAIKLVEQTAKLRREVEPLKGPGREALDEDMAELRILSMRVANRLCAWGGRLWIGTTAIT